MSSYIEIGRETPSASGKTSVWRVAARMDGAVLGEIKWFGRWRRYSFYPTGDAIFEQGCLRQIADFCERKTRRHQTKREPACR